MSPKRPLRLLTLTNTFPPVAHGGYGEICGDVSIGLASRGHNLTVLTGKELPAGGSGSEVVELVVRRELNLLLGPWRRPREALRVTGLTQTAVRSAIAQGIDAALVWHMRGVLKPSLRLLHDAGVPVIYMLHDRWVIYERAGSLTVPLYKLDRLGLTHVRNALAQPLAGWRELRAAPIRTEGHICFVSAWLRDEYARRGWKPRHASVISAGVDLSRFRTEPARPPTRDATSIVYAGRLHATKGLHVLVEALARTSPGLYLTVVGHAEDAQYAARVREQATTLGVADRIAWRGELSREQMPALLLEHDILAYPSIGVESGWLGVLEGLAAGAIVVSSAPGAPGELVEDGANALSFRADDPVDLAQVLERVRHDAALRQRVRIGARASAEAHTLDRMVVEIEQLVGSSVKHAASATCEAGA